MNIKERSERILASTAFFVGELCSIVMYWPLCGWAYVPYNKLMSYDNHIDHKYNIGKWVPPDQDKEDNDD